MKRKTKAPAAPQTATVTQNEQQSPVSTFEQTAALEAPFTPHQTELLSLATQTVEAGREFADRFRNMVAYIREKEMLPNEVNPVLIRAGFAANRASEIKTLAYSPTEVWQEYNQGQIGWRPALERARETGSKTNSRGRKRKKREAAFDELCGAHSKAAKTNAKVHGIHHYGDNTMIVFQLKEGAMQFDVPRMNAEPLTISVSIKTAAESGRLKPSAEKQ